MSKYRLTYFQPRALAECSRLVLHYAGQEFEDVRLSHDELPTLKDCKYETVNRADWSFQALPYGQIPLLEVDGQKICQSGAIVRFLANRFGLNGKNEFETAKADEIYGFFYDSIRSHMPYNAARLGLTPDADTKKLHQEVFLPAARKALPVYDNLIKWSTSGFLLPGGLSYIDFVVAEHLHTIFLMEPQFAEEYPSLTKFKNKIHTLPQIADYVRQRPNTIV
ncbi:Glutathione S-transferase-1 [Aphelenchoides besseyi]|nr:Glutathione S-transferase-1 [Aphelenchoides besseyi]